MNRTNDSKLFICCSSLVNGKLEILDLIHLKNQIQPEGPENHVKNDSQTSAPAPTNKEFLGFNFQNTINFPHSQCSV